MGEKSGKWGMREKGGKLWEFREFSLASALTLSISASRATSRSMRLGLGKTGKRERVRDGIGKNREK